MKKCRVCSETKSIEEFYKGLVCSACTSKRVSERWRKNNAESLKSATNQRKPWTTRELDALDVLVARKIPKAEIARSLGRSLASVYSKTKKAAQ